jgi:hypothetical protein
VQSRGGWYHLNHTTSEQPGVSSPAQRRRVDAGHADGKCCGSQPAVSGPSAGPHRASG